MYLKRIEMSGFKSFAERTVIEFEQGLTAIVGPNGSGKSNVTEAVRWVLGEQSAKNLRGDKMYDVIFAGSSQRHAMNVCEVTIVLDNSDGSLPVEYDEVSVMRRLTRSGDSYYAINKKQCRLKDIVDLFMDSGLGKHSFSIISQGKVEAIFDDKPENRRSLFEETAGVLKYKQRKQKAEQKLGETEDNLDRIDDILYELQSQLGPLQEQVNVAKEYQKLKNEHQKLDLNLQVSIIKQNKQKYDYLQDLLPKQMTKIENLEVEKAQLEQSIQSLTSDFQTSELNLEKLQQSLVRIVEEYEKEQARKQIALERKNHQTETKQEVKLAILEEKANQTELAAKLAGELAQKHELEQKLELCHKQLEEYQRELQLIDQEQKVDIDELQEQYFVYMQEQATVRNDKQHLERQYSQEQAKVTRYSAQEEEIDQRYQKLVQETNSVQEQVRIYQKTRATIEKEQAMLQTTLEHENAQLDKRQHQLNQANNLYQQALLKKKSLSDLKANYQGFYQGVKVVLQAKDNLSGIYGAVAECLNMDPRYAQAIEVAIGSAMQNIIVRDEIAAARAINYLKQKHQGRATFLPLSIIKSKTLNEQMQTKLQELSGFIGVGIDLVQYEEIYHNVISSLLGQTVVVDNLDNANKISNYLNYQYKVVTLDGEIIRPGGAMTGGFNKHNSSVLTNQVELQELSQKIPDMHKKVQQLQHNLDSKKKEIAQLSESLQSKNEEYHKCTVDLQNNEKILAVKEQQLSTVEKEQKAVSIENKQMQSFFETYQKELLQLKNKEEWLAKEINDLQYKIQNVSQTKEAKQQQRESLLKKYSEQETSYKWQKQVVANSSQRVLELEEQKKKSDNKITKWQTQIELMEKELTAEELVKIEENISIISKQKVDIAKKIEHSKAHRQQVKDCLDNKERLFSTNLDNLTLEKGEYQKNSLTLEQLNDTLDNSLEYLQSEYQLTYERAAQQAKEIDTSETQQVEDQVKFLKQQIKSLGPVNLASLEQYDNLDERYQFMSTQRNDLVEAKEQLLGTMSEMDQKVKEQFKTTFEQIAAKFNKLFPEIFGGGSANLRLTDEEDLLNTGIEIEAQPPGKKLQNLSLLSGGERALTAITLLFAMIQVKPVPFCILDEVEAALDEANVYRFGKYLQHLDDKTQFIVITHRKGTMEATDVLYGVTMQESGVSNLVSVKMETLADELS